MNLEDYLEEAKTPLKPKCYQTTDVRRRFEVWARDQRYVFAWMHWIQGTLDLSGTEIKMELTHMMLSIQGVALGALFEAFLKEEVAWICAFPETVTPPMETLEPWIQRIQVEPKAVPPPLPRLAKPTTAPLEARACSA